METVLVNINGRITWKGLMQKQLKRDDTIIIGKFTYRVVAAKVESGVQTALISSRNLNK